MNKPEIIKRQYEPDLCVNFNDVINYLKEKNPSLFSEDNVLILEEMIQESYEEDFLPFVELVALQEGLDINDPGESIISKMLLAFFEEFAKKKLFHSSELFVHNGGEDAVKERFPEYPDEITFWEDGPGWLLSNPYPCEEDEDEEGYVYLKVKKPEIQIMKFVDQKEAFRYLDSIFHDSSPELFNQNFLENFEMELIEYCGGDDANGDLANDRLLGFYAYRLKYQRLLDLFFAQFGKDCGLRLCWG